MGKGGNGAKTGKANATEIASIASLVQSQVAQNLSGSALNVSVVLADLGLSSSAPSLRH